MTTRDEQNEASHLAMVRKAFPMWSWSGIWCRKEKKLRLFEVLWLRGLGPGYGAPENYQAKVSVGIELKVEDLWIGAFWKTDSDTKETFLWLCLIPCLPIRIHYQRSYGGWWATGAPSLPVDSPYRRRWWQIFKAV